MTGATPEQIEAATCNRYQATSAMAKDHPWFRMNPDLRRTMCDLFVRDAAQWLVPPDDRIVSVEDLEMLLRGCDWSEINTDEEQDLIDRIRALIGPTP